MTAFSIITGLVTLVGFFLQIKGLYPQYRKYYAAVTFFLFGLTVGSFLSSFIGVTISLPESLSARNILGIGLFFGTGLIIFVCFTASALIGDSSRRSEVSRIGSAASGFLIFLILLCIPSFFPEHPNYLTYDEQIECTLSAMRRQNYDRAILLASDAMKPLLKDDVRRSNLEKLIVEARRQQAALPTSAVPPSGTPSVAP